MISKGQKSFHSYLEKNTYSLSVSKDPKRGYLAYKVCYPHLPGVYNSTETKNRKTRSINQKRFNSKSRHMNLRKMIVSRSFREKSSVYNNDNKSSFSTRVRISNQSQFTFESINSRIMAPKVMLKCI